MDFGVSNAVLDFAMAEAKKIMDVTVGFYNKHGELPDTMTALVISMKDDCTQFLPSVVISLMANQTELIPMIANKYLIGEGVGVECGVHGKTTPDVFLLICEGRMGIINNDDMPAGMTEETLTADDLRAVPNARLIDRAIIIQLFTLSGIVFCFTPTDGGMTIGKPTFIDPRSDSVDELLRQAALPDVSGIGRTQH